MKKLTSTIYSIIFTLVTANVSFAGYGYNHGYHNGYHNGYYNGRHNGNLDAVNTGILAGFGATLLSLTIDSASRHNYAMIEQAETEALAYEENMETSETFQSAKNIFETNGQVQLTDAQAAVLIVEYNQAMRSQN